VSASIGAGIYAVGIGGAMALLAAIFGAGQLSGCVGAGLQVET